jgi:hypothetical protein
MGSSVGNGGDLAAVAQILDDLQRVRDAGAGEPVEAKDEELLPLAFQKV